MIPTQKTGLNLPLSLANSRRAEQGVILLRTSVIFDNTPFTTGLVRNCERH